MKLIEGMKKIKELQVKAEELRRKVGQYHADLSYETPTYDNQVAKISEWLQGHRDLVKEILKLRIAVQKTNLQTDVTIELGGKQVTKTIAEWVHRRRDLAELDRSIWGKLTDKGLKEGQVKNSAGETTDVKIRRYYKPEERDGFLDLYSQEPSIIDRTLEVKNAVTDLIE